MVQAYFYRVPDQRTAKRDRLVPLRPVCRQREARRPLLSTEKRIADEGILARPRVLDIARWSGGRRLNIAAYSKLTSRASASTPRQIEIARQRASEARPDNSLASSRPMPCPWPFADGSFERRRYGFDAGLPHARQGRVLSRVRPHSPTGAVSLGLDWFTKDGLKSADEESTSNRFPLAQRFPI